MSNWISFGYDNHAVADSLVGADHKPARKAFIKDLVRAHRAAVDIGITDVAVLRGLYGTGMASAVIASHIGVDKTLKYLAALVQLSNKHKGYLLAIEKDKPEGKKLLAVLRRVFNERLLPGKQVKLVKAAKAAGVMGAWVPLLLLAGLGAAIFFVIRSIGKDGGAAVGTQGLLDYFVLKMKAQAKPADDAAAATLADSLKLPKTAAAIRANAALPSDENWPGTNISVVEYVRKYMGGTAPGQTPAQVPLIAAPAVITQTTPLSDAGRVLAYASAVAGKKLGKLGFGDPAAQRTEAIGAAMRMRITITAQVIRAGTLAFPTNEMWPGTNTSVNAYIRAHLMRVGLGAAMPASPAVSGVHGYDLVSDAAGCRIKGLGGAFELGAGAGKDDEGVESCGNDSDAMGFGPLAPVAVGLGSYLLGYRLGAGHWGIAGDELVAGSLEEIVGQAKAAKLRKTMARRGLRPPTRRPGRAPGRKEIVTMPEMVVTPGTTGRPMDPKLLEILRMIDHGSAPIRGHGIPVQRFRAGWPGSRGEGAY